MLWLTCIWNQGPSGFHSRIRGTFSATFWCWKLGLFIPPSSTGFHLSFLSVFFAHSYTDTVAKQLIVTFFASHFLFCFFFSVWDTSTMPPSSHMHENYDFMLKLKLQYFDHLIRTADSWEKTLMLGKTEGRRRRGWQRRQLDGITDSMAMNLGKLWEMVRDREAWHAAVHWAKKSRTRLGDWTTANKQQQTLVLK